MGDLPPELLSTAGGFSAVSLFVLSIMTGRLLPRGTVDSLMKVLQERNDQLDADLEEAKRLLTEGDSVRAELAQQLTSITAQFDELLDMLDRRGGGPAANGWTRKFSGEVIRNAPEG